MNAIKSAMIALLLTLSFVASSALAGEKDPLFINATSDDAHRAEMALAFSKNELERQHPVTVFLNDKAVFIASKPNAERFKNQQALLTSLMDKGATVLVCPICLKYYGITETDLLPGVKMGNPELVDAALFKENTKTLSW